MIKFIIQLDKSMCYAGSCLNFFQYKKEPRWCEHSEKKRLNLINSVNLNNINKKYNDNK